MEIKFQNQTINLNLPNELRDRIKSINLTVKKHVPTKAEDIDVAISVSVWTIIGAMLGLFFMSIGYCSKEISILIFIASASFSIFGIKLISVCRKWAYRYEVLYEWNYKYYPKHRSFNETVAMEMLKSWYVWICMILFTASTIYAVILV